MGTVVALLVLTCLSLWLLFSPHEMIVYQPVQRQAASEEASCAGDLYLSTTKVGLPAFSTRDSSTVASYQEQRLRPVGSVERPLIDLLIEKRPLEVPVSRCESQ